MPEILGTSKSISQFDPRSIPGCQLWFDAADTSSLTFASSNTISTWKDKSSNGWNLTTVGSNPPGYSSNGFNGNPCITFTSGSNQDMRGPASGTVNFTNFYPINGGNTVFMVFSQTGGTCGGIWFQWTGQASGGSYGIQAFSGNNLCWSAGGYNTQMTNALGANMLVSWVNVLGADYGTNTSTVNIFGIPGGATTGSISTSGYTWNYSEYFVIGAKDSNHNYRAFGNHCEYIVYNQALTDTQRQQVEGYLAWKWGIETIPQATLAPGIPPAGALSGIPTDIGGCVLWLDGADTSTFRISSGTTIDTWVDKSGNGYNATPYGTGTTVTYDYSSKAVYFPGSAGLKTSLATPTNRVQSGFFVATVSSSSVGVIQGCSNSTGGRQFRTTGTLRTLQENISLLLASGTTPVNALMLVGYTDDGTTITHSVNGTTTSGTSATAFTSGTTVTLGYSFNTEYMVGYINEAIIYSNALSSTSRQQVEGYLAKKWGITVSTPSAINGLVLWLDGADPLGNGTLPASNATVATWYDKSGNSNNAAYVSATSTITATPATYGSPGVVFSSSSKQSYAITTLSSLMYTQSVFAVAKYSGTGQYEIVSLYQTSGANGDGAQQIIDNTGGAGTQKIWCYGGSGVMYVQGGSISQNTNFLYNYTINSGGTSYIYLNGIQTGSASTTIPGGSGYVTIGAVQAGTGGNDYYNGTVYEVLIYNTILTTDQRQRVESYLITKWGIGAYATNYTPVLNSPVNTPGCVLWLDATDTSTITGTTTMTAWRDKSSNAYTANSFSNSVAAPSWVSNAPSAKSAVQYSAGNGSSIANFVLAQTMSIFEVYYAINQSTSGPFIEHGPDENSNSGFYLYSGGGQNFGINSGSGQIAVNVGNVTLSNTWQLIEGINPDPSSSSTMAFYVDGQVKASGSTQSGTTTVTRTLFINGRNGANSVSYNAYLAELIIFSNALNTTQRQAVERYLSLKWGLSNFYTSIPGSIPGLTLWLDGADTTTMTFPSGSNVSGWKDKGSLGFTLSNLNSGIYPSFIPNLGVYFSNSFATSNASCQAIGNSSVWYVPTQNATLLVSYKPTSTDSFRAPLIIGTTAGTSSRPHFYLSPQCGASEADSILYDYNGTNWSMNAYASINTYAGLRIDTLVSTPGATSGFIFFNGTETTYSNTPIAPYTSTYTNYPATVQVALGSMFGNRAFNGYIQEILFYSNALTTTQRQVAEAYLAKKWSNTSVPNEVLPTTHPFLSVRPFTRPFAPVDISGCILWLDAQDYSTFTFSSGSNISNWKDKSGMSNDVTRVTATPPTYSSTSNAVVFNAYNTTGMGGSFSTQYASNASVFVVGSYTSNTGSTGYPRMMALGTLTNNTNYVGQLNIIIQSTVPYLSSYGAVSGATAAGFNVLTAIPTSFSTNFLYSSVSSMAGTSLTVNTFLNGNTSTYSSGSGTATVDGIYYSNVYNLYSIGNYVQLTASSGDSFNGNIYEVIVYSNTLSTSDRRQIEGYLAWKWGLCGSLPSAHPFYTFPSSSVLPFLPTNIYGLSVWFDAADMNTLTTSGSNITSWSSKGSISLTAYPLSGGVGTPVGNGTNSNAYGGYLTTGVKINGLNAVSCPAQTTYGMNSTVSFSNQARSIFAVFSVASAGSVPYLTFFSCATVSPNNQTGMNQYIYYDGQQPSLFAEAGASATSILQALPSPSQLGLNATNMAAWVQSSSSTANNVITLNGISQTLTTNTVASTYATSAQYYFIGSAYSQAYTLCEYLMFNIELATDQRQQIEGYLAQKWRI